MAVPVIAGDVPLKKGETSLRHYAIVPIQAFGFRSGIVNLGNVLQRADTRVDLFYNGMKGLGVNNAGFGQNFLGGGGIIDMGPVELDTIDEAPESGYKLYINIRKIKPGRSYCVRCADGVHYARMRVIEIEKGDRGYIRFAWEYLPAAGRTFRVKDR